MTNSQTFQWVRDGVSVPRKFTLSAESMTSTHAWFVKTKTGIAGPFTPGQLKGFADSEKLPKSALVSKQADGPWVAAEQIRGLFDPPNDRVVEEEQIGPADLVPDAVKKSAAVVGNVMTGLSKNVVSSLKNAASNLSAKIESATTSVSAYCVDGQDPSVVEKMIHRVREICTNDEEILYVAMQAKPIANFSPDCVVISNKRFIIFRPKMLGRVTFYDCLWKESKDVHLKENILGAEISFESKSGHVEKIDYVPKAQARNIYRIGQQMEEDAIALRRKLDIEALQAGADKTVIHQVISANPECSKQSDEEDIVARMAKLKSLFDNGLISQEEYQAKRSNLLDSI
jgi:hypothetical protein